MTIFILLKRKLLNLTDNRVSSVIVGLNETTPSVEEPAEYFCEHPDKQILSFNEHESQLFYE